MKLSNTINFLPALLLVTFFPISSHAVIDDDTQSVHLREICTENSVEIPNCFTSSSTLTSWLNTTSTKTKVSVEIGAGKFGYFNVGAGLATKKISLNGSGPNVTSFDGMQFSGSDVHVQDLTVNNSFPAPVYWHGSGKSTWENVHLDGGIYGWTETCAGITEANRAVHYWHSSRITAIAKTAYQVGCSENWFFGTELSNKGVLGGLSTALLAGGYNGQENTKPEAHFYGSVLRNTLSTGDTHTPTVISANKNAVIHIHGTGIDVIGNELENDVIALHVSNGGMIHASQSSYVMKTDALAKATRIKNDGGTVKAPYLWEPEILNLGNNFVSVDGADSTTEIVCNGSNCGPHTMIYSNSCSVNGPWFDTTTNSCR
jgi:hypothetical protein